MDDCPSDEDLGAFLIGNGVAVIGTHLRGCRRCQEAADRLSDLDNPRPLATRLADRTWDWSGDGQLRSIVASLRDDSPFDLPTELATPGPATAAEVPGRIGPYDVEAEVGRGGMGVVYRARDRTTGQVVALKVPHAGGDGPRSRRRFIQEVRAVARVEHDHVVRLYATSDPDAAVPYFAMEYLAGPSLAERNHRGERVGPREAAEIVAQVAEGLQAAHDRGLVHGDVKPANILLDPATGRAKIGDFGLARIAAEGPQPSREGLIPGTPAYLSPEQARGVPELDPRSDVYSLGVTLYECLAGEVPFRGEPHRIIHQVLNDEPRPPRVLDDAIPRDLETICLKAMAKEASKRYPTASAFADDLRRFLRGEPIRARPVGPLERGWRWCRNNRRVASLVALAALLLVALAAGATVAAARIDRERSRAVEQARIAEERRGQTLDAFNSLIEGVQDKLASRPGTLELRRSLLEIARKGLVGVAQGGSGEDQARVDDRAVVAMLKLGDVDLVLGRTADAMAEFDKAASMAEASSAANAKSVALRRSLAGAYDRLGDAVDRQDAGNEQEVAYQKAQAIRRALIAERPGDAMIRRDLRVSRGKLGDAFIAKGDFTRARESFEEYRRSLLAEPEDAGERRLRLKDLRWISGRIGRLAWNEYRADEALAALRESLRHAEALCSLDPDDVSSRRERGYALDYLGAACTRFGDLPGAERALAAFREDRAAAARDDPADRDAIRSLALAHQHLGELAARREDFGGATSGYLEASSLFEDLARRDPASVQAHKDRLIVLRKLSELEFTRNHFDEGLKWLDRELEVLAVKDVSPRPDHASWVAETRFLRDGYSMVARVIEDPELARDLPPPMKGFLLQLRAIALARAGRVEAATSAAAELLALPDDVEHSLVAAHVHAMIASSFSGEDHGRRASHVEASLKALSRAIRIDPAQDRRFPFDPRFDGIKDEPAFQALIPHQTPQ